MTTTRTRPVPRRWGRSGRLAIPAVATAALLAACAGGGDSGGGDNAGGGGDEGSDSTVTAWVSREWSNSHDDFATFMEENPDITVETEVIDTDDILERLLRAADAGQPLPDIIQDDVFTLEAYNDAGFVIPLDAYLETFAEEDQEEFEKVLPIAYEEATLDGEVFGISNAANMDVLYYNVPWFEEAGVEVPFETYEDVFAGAEALQATRPDETVMSIQAVAGDGVTGLKTVLIGTGAEFEGATPDLQSSAGLYTIDFFQRLQAAGALPDEAIAWGEAEARGAFISGAGMIIDGFTTAGDFNDAEGFTYGEDWGMTLLPTASGQGDEGDRPTSSRSWSITTGAENPEAAWEVIKYTTTPEFLVPQVLQGGVPPRNTDALEDPRAAEFWPFFSDEVKDGFKEAVGAPSALNAGDVEQVLEQMWGEIVTGTDATPQELADKYQPMLEDLEA